MKQQNLPGTKSVSHSNRGKSFETELEATHSLYAVKHLARMEKNPNEWRYCGASEYQSKAKLSGGDFVAQTNTGKYIKRVKSDVDFSGLVIGGRKVVFDAKETQGKSLPLSRITEHQLRTLVENEQLGAIAGVMIHFSDLSRVFFVSARVVDAAVTEMLYKKARKSLSLADCEEKGCEIPLQNRLVDWFQVLVTEKRG